MPYKNPEDIKKYREANKEKLAAQAAIRHQNRKRNNKQYVRNIKSTTPCTDCKVEYPYYVMDFDHITEDKTMEVSVLMRTGGFVTLKEEIAKCEIICPNCHALETAKAKN